MGPAHCTSGATYCSEISSTLAWGRKVPSVRGVPREGSTRVLSVERLCTSREVLRTLLPFRPRAIWRLRLKARARSRSYTLHYSSCSTRRITQACVFTPHHNNNILLWGFNTHRLIKLQKRAIRIITDSKYNSHTEPLLKSLNILKINDIFTIQCLKFFS